jgi:hypothetical protein
MAREVKYTFGGVGFTSRDAVKRHGANIRSRYDHGETISEPADHAFLRDLIACHAERETKVGSGIKRFYYDTSPDHPNASCFYLERLDGSATDFGVPACLVGIRQLNLQSMRMAVRSEVERFKNEKLGGNPTFMSAFSQKEFPSEECAVDHVVPFDTIVEKFCVTHGIEIDAELVTKSTDMRSDAVWKDDGLRRAFVSFHADYELRLVHHRENISEIARLNNAAQRDSAGS